MSDRKMKFKSQLAALTGTLFLVLMSGTGQADDTDIHVGGTLPPGSEPLVMFSLDWRPNLGSTACNQTITVPDPSDPTLTINENECQFLIDGGYMSAVGPYTFFDVLRGVLRRVLEPLDGLKLGLMLNHDYKSNCENKVVAKCSNGGFIALGAKSFDLADTNGAKAAFHNYLAAIPSPQGSLSHPYQGKELFYELYRYFTGQGIYNGHVGFLDFDSDPLANMRPETPNTAWDNSPAVESGTNYVSPLSAAGSCTKLFTVNMMFQVSQVEDNSDSALTAAFPGGMNFAANGVPRPDFPNVIEWLNDKDLGDGTVPGVGTIDGKQNVTSYFVVDPTKINTTTTAYSTAGGTGSPLALSSDPRALIKTLTDVFSQIISVSTTFVAASVPVNSFNRAEIIDNVYIALFQTDKSGQAFWHGNVKKLRIKGLALGTPALRDANDNPAISADGRLRYDALTYWTNAGALPPPDPNANEIAGSDGRSVNRGGAGQKIPGFLSGYPGLLNSDAGARKMLYDNGTLNLAALNSDPATATALQTVLGAGSVAEAQAIIAHARGVDIDDADGDGVRKEPRDWIFGDPLHSRPLPLNFGARGGYSSANPAIYIAVASNDGALRLLRNTTTGGAESGEEVWSFVPQSVMGKLKTLRANPVGAHPYLFDGSPIAYADDANQNGTIDAGEKAYLYIGLRRGGKVMYGFDISDPENPKLLFNPITKSGDFTELGHTFSAPRIITTKEGGTQRPAIVFGGGYDMNKDSRGGVGTDDTEGNAIYVVDAETGALIWKAVGGAGTSTGNKFVHTGLVDSIPSDISILDGDGNGVHDRLYVGDTGGNLWRADIHGTDKSNWKLTILAKLGRHAPASAGKTDDRRFFHRPDVVQTFESHTRVDAVVIGSGDRTDPLDKGGFADNWAYMIKDHATAAGAGTDTSLQHASLGDVTNTCLTETGTCTAVLTNGWKMNMQINGEKVLAKPLTIANTVYFTSYVPSAGFNPDTCAPSEGTGRLYAVSLKNGAAKRNFDTTTVDADRSMVLKSAGIPSEVVAISTQMGPEPATYILPPGDDPLPTGESPRFKTFWFEEEDGDL
jgi:type IV pilus assembly protein PilY1